MSSKSIRNDLDHSNIWHMAPADEESENESSSSTDSSNKSSIHQDPHDLEKSMKIALDSNKSGRDSVLSPSSEITIKKGKNTSTPELSDVTKSKNLTTNGLNLAFPFVGNIDINNIKKQISPSYKSLFNNNPNTSLLQSSSSNDLISRSNDQGNKGQTLYSTDNKSNVSSGLNSQSVNQVTTSSFITTEANNTNRVGNSVDIVTSMNQTSISSSNQFAALASEVEVVKTPSTSYPYDDEGRIDIQFITPELMELLFKNRKIHFPIANSHQLKKSYDSAVALYYNDEAVASEVNEIFRSWAMVNEITSLKPYILGKKNYSSPIRMISCIDPDNSQMEKQLHRIPNQYTVELILKLTDEAKTMITEEINKGIGVMEAVEHAIEKIPMCSLYHKVERLPAQAGNGNNDNSIVAWTQMQDRVDGTRRVLGSSAVIHGSTEHIAAIENWLMILENDMFDHAITIAKLKGSLHWLKSDRSLTKQFHLASEYQLDITDISSLLTAFQPHNISIYCAKNGDTLFPFVFGKCSLDEHNFLTFNQLAQILGSNNMYVTLPENALGTTIFQVGFSPVLTTQLPTVRSSWKNYLYRNINGCSQMNPNMNAQREEQERLASTLTEFVNQVLVYEYLCICGLPGIWIQEENRVQLLEHFTSSVGILSQVNIPNPHSYVQNVKVASIGFNVAKIKPITSTESVLQTYSMIIKLSKSFSTSVNMQSVYVHPKNKKDRITLVATFLNEKDLEARDSGGDQIAAFRNIKREYLQAISKSLIKTCAFTCPLHLTVIGVPIQSYIKKLSGQVIVASEIMLVIYASTTLDNDTLRDIQKRFTIHSKVDEINYSRTLLEDTWPLQGAPSVISFSGKPYSRAVIESNSKMKHIQLHNLNNTSPSQILQMINNEKLLPLHEIKLVFEIKLNNKKVYIILCHKLATCTEKSTIHLDLAYLDHQCNGEHGPRLHICTGKVLPSGDKINHIMTITDYTEPIQPNVMQSSYIQPTKKQPNNVSKKKVMTKVEDVYSFFRKK